MDNIVLWVALVGVIGTLVGVWLGNWLQSRNLKRQREWMLRDQKREWVRRQRREKFERILGYVNGTLQYIAKAKWILQFGSKELKEELFLKYAEQAAVTLAIVYTMRGEDKKLADLLLEFSQDLEGTKDIIASKSFDVSDKEQHLSNLAGLIRQRIDELLEETFD